MGTSTSRMASVPPVEAPMQMTFSVVASRGSGTLGTALAAWEPLAAAAPLAGVAARRRTCACEATRILSTMSWASSFSPLVMPMRGLAT